MENYSAKLLFQWRPEKNGKFPKRRVCEERIVTFQANSAEKAYLKSQKIGKAAEYKDEIENGIIHFEFIGVLDLLENSLSFAEGEVWHELKEMLTPLERKGTLIPPKSELRALQKNAPKNKGRIKLY